MDDMNQEHEGVDGAAEKAGIPGGDLTASEEKYRSIFNAIPNPVFLLDRKHLKILECNLSVKDVFGYGREELLGVSFLKLFESAEHQNYALELRSSELLYHVKQLTKDGRSIFVNIRVSPYECDGRQALLVTLSDVIRTLTVRRQMVQASKMSTLGEMATGIAHELNQPLSVIKTASSFLMNRLGKGEMPRSELLMSMIKEIDSHVDRASNIIGHIKDFGRKSEARRDEVQINTVLQEAVDIFGQQLKLRCIEVRCDFEDKLPTVGADRNRLEQVFVNLIINARDAIEEKRGQSCNHDKLDELVLKTRIHDGGVRVEVKDTGVGIPEALLDRIFEPFFTTKKEGKGTGLGLSIAYGIVQDYGGTIHVETAAGEGSNFIIQFPIQVNSDG